MVTHHLLSPLGPRGPSSSLGQGPKEQSGDNAPVRLHLPAPARTSRVPPTSRGHPSKEGPALEPHRSVWSTSSRGRHRPQRGRGAQHSGGCRGRSGESHWPCPAQSGVRGPMGQPPDRRHRPAAPGVWSVRAGSGWVCRADAVSSRCEVFSAKTKRLPRPPQCVL